jgi:hypothetical protein
VVPESARASSPTRSPRKVAAKAFDRSSSALLGCCEQLSIARASADYNATLARIAKIDVLVLDDFLLAPLADTERRDLLEVLEDRYGKTSTVITSQLPTKSWHAALGDPTIADASCHRLVHNAQILSLRCSSLRRQKGLKPQPDPPNPGLTSSLYSSLRSGPDRILRNGDRMSPETADRMRRNTQAAWISKAPPSGSVGSRRQSKPGARDFIGHRPRRITRSLRRPPEAPSRDRRRGNTQRSVVPSGTLVSYAF